MRCEIRLSGSGGQGLVLAGVILGEAMVATGYQYVVQTRSFGPEMRGGASKSDIIFSDQEIFYTKARKLDILLALSQKACDEYVGALSSNGILIVDSKYVTNYPQKGMAFPCSQTSREYFDTELFANIISLGVISELTKIVTIEEIILALSSRVPKELLDSNIKALNLGVDSVKKNHQTDQCQLIITKCHELLGRVI